MTRVTKMPGQTRKKYSEATNLDSTPIESLPTPKSIKRQAEATKTSENPPAKKSKVDRLKQRLKSKQEKHESQKVSTSNQEPTKKKRFRSAEAKKKRRDKLKQLSTICYNCRKTGHRVGDCPEKNQSNLCFRCGKSHALKDCPEKVDPKNPYPHALCFQCNQKGHIISQCPQNEHGVYPKGGCCKHCQSVRHLAKDCPELKKKEEKPSTEIALGKMTGREGGDDDDFAMKPKESSKPVQSKPKKKVVKF